MRFVPKGNVRVQLTLTILLVILLSWLCSTIMSNYLILQGMRNLRETMLLHPELYPHPLPEPQIGLRELLLGPAEGFAHLLDQPRPPRATSLARPPGMAGEDGEPGPPEPSTRDAGEPGPRPQRDDVEPGPSRPPAQSEGGAGRRPLGTDFALGPPRPRGPASLPGADLYRIVIFARAFVALFFALLAGAWLSRKFTRPLSELSHGAQMLQHGNFAYRLPVHGGDEFTQVSQAMNGMAERVARQISHLEEEARRRQQFLADVAHELRSPVTTLRMMAGALEEGLAEDPERHTRAVHSLVRTSDRLQHLVTDLLELAKLDLHELPLHRQPVDVRELAGACLQAHAPAAAQAGVLLQPVAPGEPLMLEADPDRLAQVLDNLIENAIHYAGVGAQVAITMTEDDPVRLMVEDTGQGIPARHLPYLFDAFYRVDTSRTPGNSPSGLGLRITRGLVEAHGGTLTLDSEVGKGTRVMVSLPRG